MGKFMAFVKKTRYLLAPPYSRLAETFISPILSSPYEISDGLKLAGGWRYFKNLRVIQKKKIILLKSKCLLKNF